MISFSQPQFKSLLALFGKSIGVIFDSKGRIIDIAPNTRGHFARISDTLKKAGSMTCLFNLPANLSGLKEFNRPNREMPLTFDEGLDDFYTLVPVIQLTSSRYGTGVFLGSITVSDLLPNLFEENEKSVLIYMDQAGRLVGYTQGFHHFFRDSFPLPTAMLGLQAGRFFGPLPAEIQEERISHIRPAADSVWKTQFLIQDTSDELPSMLKREADELVWEAGSGPLSAITLREPVDTDRQEVRLIIETSGGSSHIPGIIFGDREPAEGFYDRDGYTISHQPNARKIQLKKIGYVIHETPMAGDGGGTFELVRTGPCFRFLRNGGLVFQYFDLHTLGRNRYFITVFLRAGERCGLKSIRLETRAAATLPPAEEVMVRLKDPAGTQCLLDRVTNFPLTGFHSSLSGYRLRNVSVFRDRIRKLEHQLQRQQQEGRKLKGLLTGAGGAPIPFIGVSRSIQLLREKAERIAASSAGVLIQGPTGTGKEVLARHLHQSSPRRDKPFIKVDCSTLPASLLESEIFGHEKGAFTGADRAKPGLFERAEGGTLFIDEINNLPMAGQAKLLQFLQDHTVTHIGGGAPIPLDVRVLVASGVPLPEQVGKGAFREDLYFRIAVVTFEMPPLKDRLEDLPALCEYFLSLFGRAGGREVERIAADAYRKMYAHHWPGNVRELRNVIEQATLFCEGEEITAPLIRFPDIAENRSIRFGNRKSHGSLQATRDELESLLGEFKGSVKQAARKLDVTVRALYYVLKKEDLDPNRFRKRPRAKQSD